MDANFSAQRKVKYFKYSGLFLKSCGFLNERLSFIAPIVSIIGVSGSLHLGIFVFLEFNTIELSDIIQYSHMSQLFFVLSTFLVVMYINKEDVIDIYLSTLKGLYRYPWGNWTYEINIRTGAENGIKLFYSIYPLAVLIACIQEILRHAYEPSRKSNDPLSKGWVPIPLDSRILSVYQITMIFTIGLISTTYFTYVAAVMERLTSEIEVLKSVLRDPHYIAINTNYTIKQILKCCVEHQLIIYKYVNMTFNVLNICLLLAFINGSLLLCTMGLLLTESNLPIGIKLAIGLICSAELLAVGCLCYYGQKIYDSSDDLCFSIYRMRWYDLKPSERKMVIIIMIRSQRKLHLSGGGIKDYNFETFSEILTTAYSYMGMLRVVRQP